MSTRRDSCPSRQAAWASFADATLAGTVTSPDTDAYNGVHYSFSEHDFANHDLVYVAIQPEGVSSFRQLYIELH